jgi:glycerol-3-phosphate dehydrogenase
LCSLTFITFTTTEKTMDSKQTSFTDRKALWQQLKQEPDSHWDVIIVGGGIIGAGVLREATRGGLKALLIEQRDFAWGTSSRSSKMIHGGLRYLAQGDLKLTRHSVQERERLLKEAPGLVERIGYYFLLRKGQFPGRFAMGLVLTVYDKLAGIKDHRYVDKKAVIQQFPGVQSRDLKGACYYTDTAVDDARLVLRVLQEAIQAGGRVLNYVQAKNLIKNSSVDGSEGGQVSGVVVEDVASLKGEESGETLELYAPVVINATGAWADRLRSEVIDEKRIRPLRGSHLVFPREKLPVDASLTLFHPEDKRPVFVFPWEGATLVGTTDFDHQENLDNEASITNEEVEYLMKILALYYPNSGLGREDVISSFSGIRPVIGSDTNTDPSKERRDHAVWANKGLVTVSGGKLTTFRLIAIDALNAARAWLKDVEPKESEDHVFSTPDTQAPRGSWLSRINGRYGSNAEHLLAQADKGEQDLIKETQFCLAECRWAAKHESVVHLDDLLLRRTRLGLLLKNGAEELFPKLEKIFQKELGWDATKWQNEVSRYQGILQQHYSLPPV